MEFCVCYRTGTGQEFWDNNDGKNFEIISEHLRSQRSQMPQMNIGTGATASEGQQDSAAPPQTTDVMVVNCKNWTEFASWSDLSTGANGYYWKTM